MNLLNNIKILKKNINYNISSKSKFLNDSIVLAAGIFLAQVVAILAMPIITRLYSPIDFGRYTLVMALVGIIGFIGTIRLEALIPSVTTKYDALLLVQAVFVISLTSAGAIFILLVMFNEKIQLTLMPSGEMTNSLYALPAIILIYSINSALRTFFVREGRFGSISQGQIARAVSLSLIWIIFGVFGFTEWGMIAGQVVCDLVFSRQLLSSLRKNEYKALLKPNIKRSIKIISDNRKMIKTLFTSAGLAALYGRLPVMTIGSVYGDVSAGYYGLAERIVSAPLVLLANTIGEVYRSRAASLYRNGNTFDVLMKKVLLLLITISIIPFCLALWVSSNYINLILGENWSEAAYTITFLIVAGFFSFNSTPVDKAAIIVGARDYILKINLLRLAIEGFLAGLAFSGMIVFKYYITLIVVGRCIIYALDVYVNYMLAARPRIY